MDSLLADIELQETHGMSMDALRLRRLALAIFLFAACRTEAATYQTVNFSVTAARPEVAEQVGKAAEVYRRQLATFWIGKPLPNWSRPCKVAVSEGALGAGGQTTFQFVRGEVLNWRMEVQGSLERILDSVLPHEINHTIFACHFRRPLPRWADEGAATLFEHRSEQLKQLALLKEVIRNKNEMISLQDLLSMKEYPKGQRPMLTLYAQGYALADFLVQQKGRHAYLKFISDGERGGWDQAIRNNFDHDGIASLEKNWRGWVLAGMPKLTLPREQMLASTEGNVDSGNLATARPEMPVEVQPAPSKPKRRSQAAVVRSQSPDAIKPIPPGDLKPLLPSGPAVDAVTAGDSESRRVAAVRGSVANTENKTPRRASIVAPLPRSLAQKFQPTPGNDLAAEGSQTSDSFFEDVPTRPGIEAEGKQRSANEFDFDDLEPTALTTPGVGQGNEGPSAGHEESFQFSGVDLPRERKVSSGSTPKWAGFPGQKKSF